MPAEVAAHVARQLELDIDWRYLLEEAQRHGVLPLLGHHVSRGFWQAVPAEVRDRLMQACQHVQRRAVALTAELLRILTILDQAGLAAIPFKGPVLAAAAYGNLAHRTFADLDILVHMADLRKARELLVDDGYIAGFNLPGPEERAYLREECALQLRHPQRDTVVELHWLLTERYLSINLPVELFWKRSVPMALAGRRVLTFRAEDLFLYLCLHAGKHEWERLEWVSSVAAIIEAFPGMNWASVEKLARDCGINRIMRVTLLLVNTLLQVAIPPQFREDSRTDTAANALAQRSITKLFSPVDREERPHKRAGWYLFLLRTRERGSDKARIILFSALRPPHPADRQDLWLPSQLSFLHYVFRPIRLVSAGIRFTWHYWTTKRTSIKAVTSAARPASGV